MRNKKYLIHDGSGDMMTPVEAWHANKSSRLDDEGYLWLCTELERGLKTVFSEMKAPVLKVFEIVQVESMAGVEQIATGKWVSVNGFREVSGV